MVSKLRNDPGIDPAALPADSPTSAIEFAGHRLDLTASRLQRGTRVIGLRPKTWAVLLHLAERPGALVTRDQLLDAIWPDVAVTPDTINKSIGELRVALDDDSRAPRIIQTVHRRGFRFIAETRRLTAGERIPDFGAVVAPAPSAGPRPFVGRDHELTFLAERLARAEAGERQVVFITGPAGVGKTALVDAFLDSRAVGERRGPIWIGRGGCIELHGLQEPYMVVLDALERLARPPHVERLAKLMRRTAPLWLAQMPWLLGEAEAEALRRALEGVRPERMPRELAVLIEAMTTDLTLVLVLEDLHWSDPSTIDVLTLLAQRRDPARLLVIGTYRPADVAVCEHALGATVRTLRVQRLCAELPLDDLDAAGVGAYLDARLPGNDFPPALAQTIHAHTGGQPLFVVAIVDHMLSRGWILDTAPGWALTTAPETIDLGVPDDVRLMIETQLQRLTPAERGLLEVASVLTTQIITPVLAAALGHPLSAVEADCLSLAHARRFLQADGTLEWRDGSVARRYAFTHELYRQVVYEQIPEGRRLRLHREVGDAIETAYGPRAVELAPQLAAHFQLGRDAGRALHYLTAAGLRARRRYSSRDAITYLEQALIWVSRLPDTAQRARHERDVRIGLGRALGDVYGFASAPVRENYERVSALCAVPDGEAHSFEAIYARWYLHSVRADRNEALALADELAALARRMDSAAHGVLSDSVLVRTAFYDGRFAEARHHMGTLTARPLAHGLDAMPVGYGVDPVIAATLHCAGALWFLGEAELSLTTAEAGLERARESGNPFFLAAALMQTALVCLLGRDTARGTGLAAQAEQLAGAQGFAFWHALALVMKGWARIRGDAAVSGIRDIGQGVAQMGATGTRFMLAYTHAFLAEGHLRNGAVDKGLAAADDGLSVTTTTLDRGYQPELWRLRGELLLASPGDARPSRAKRRGRSVAAHHSLWPEAERCLLRAVELSRAAEARALELRAATSLAAAWQARGRTDEARGVLGPVCAWFDARLETPDLVDARAQLERLSARP